MTVIVSTSGRLHSEFVCLSFLQNHRETDRFFVVSGVQFVQCNSGLFHCRRTVFSSQLKSKIVVYYKSRKREIKAKLTNESV
jgi:hypothetical protein